MEADQPVLHAKLRLPDATGLVRPRIEQPLRDGDPTTVSLVVAPAGCGKSTVLARVAESVDEQVSWYRITSEDSTESQLVLHLCAGLRATARQTMSKAPAMDALLGELDRHHGNGTLILDDAHEIVGTPAERALERFLWLRPPSLRVIIGSRCLPDVNVPRIRVSGSLREISADDLRFRSWEVEELFATVYQQPLRPEAAAALTRRTGGWAAGLQMFHLATAGHSDAERHRAVAELAGRSRLVRSYLARNVLAELPEDRRRFLTRTSTLGLMSGELCDTLLEVAGSGQVLADLEQRQLFTTSEDDGRFYRYHEVLRTHLELALVEEVGTMEARRWYVHSGALLESVGQYRAAVRAYAKAEDWSAVSRLVRQESGSNIDAAVDDDQLQPPEEWRHDPWLALARARRRARDGAVRRADEAFREAEVLFSEPEHRDQCKNERDNLAAWLPGGSGAGRSTHWITLLRAILSGETSEPLDSGERAEERLVAGLGAVAAGRLARGRDVLTALRREGCLEPVQATVAALAVAVVDAVTVGMPDASASLSDVAALAEHDGLPWLARAAYGVQELLLVSSRSTLWRLDACIDLIAECERIGDLWGAALLMAGVAVAQRQLGDNAAAAGFEDACRRFGDVGAPVLQVWCRALALHRGQPGVAAAARAVLADCRRLRISGAEAVALSALAAASGDLVIAQNALALAAECGLPNGMMYPSKRHRGRAANAPARLACFGGFRIEIDGHALDLSQLRPQARTLLRLLSIRPEQDHHREFLESALWPKAGHSVACHRLQVAISSIRGLFGGSGVEVLRADESYRLSLPTGSAADVRDFERYLADAAVASAAGDVTGGMTARRNALSMYRGDLLPEDGPAEHIAAERQSLKLAAAAAAAVLAEECRRLGDLPGAGEAAQRSVDLDPYQDLPWVILANVHEASGDRSAAELIKRLHSRARAELGLGPYEWSTGHHLGPMRNVSRLDRGNDGVEQGSVDAVRVGNR